MPKTSPARMIVVMTFILTTFANDKWVGLAILLTGISLALLVRRVGDKSKPTGQSRLEHALDQTFALLLGVMFTRDYYRGLFVWHGWAAEKVVIVLLIFGLLSGSLFGYWTYRRRKRKAAPV
jgi:hypothetical protein